ncbi:HIT family protein [Pseudomonas aeruginosa]|jgi:diadenosine tetraphosphate (Ap4A) HIT family hydrolase|uniref:HIT family protein n=1 Tax=Pseudomonas aeruginosa TaxID=287 RepID=UPI0018C6C01F|nr:HIT family protein [Pseudomonas aeruginosa]MBG5691782.1 HIT family protein [Pseudomonas aeruginosa]MBG6882965.1 HIT family protein [Pseudomonas aeruginosa]MDI3598745.1 HIT family protein [Pseudomonas aeruginosa]MDV7898930.1 HIT family protein [Pseudomonas aeruginosa]
MTEIACPFCTLPSSRVLGENLHAFWIRDGYPISPGHSLIIPKRHVGSFFEATPEERAALLALLDEARSNVEKEYQPDGYNIGINDSAAAGQTVPHLHIHLIPRFHGDMKDPRGGVRWIIPAKADYWSQRE